MPMKSMNYAIIGVSKYESRSGVPPPPGMTQEGLVPMSDNDTPNDNLTPYGFCRCGCGERTRIADRNDYRRGHVKGKPLKYIYGHQKKLPPREPVWEGSYQCYSLSLGSGLRTLFDECDLPLIKSRRWRGQRNGRTYYVHSAEKKGVILHREILSPPDALLVDHINGNGLDNRRRNLRMATSAQNNSNSRIVKGNASVFKGVFPARSGRWMARYTQRSKSIHIGTFDTAEQAARAYDAAILEARGEFAVTNEDLGLFEN